MKLIALMLARNEEWILGASLRSVLRWVDEVVVVDNASCDATSRIISEVTGEHPWRVHCSRYVPMRQEIIRDPRTGELVDIDVEAPDAWWDEMTVRQHALELGRKHGGTHFAMVDADEILTANLMTRVYGDIRMLRPGEVLDYPMLAMRSLDEYQDDGSIWSNVRLSIAFADKPRLTWKPDGLGYHFHHRCPYGVCERAHKPALQKQQGGMMHLQFADHNRLLWKHRWYKMIERLRWPNRDTVKQVDWRYSLALEPPRMLSPADPSWWKGNFKDLIRLGGFAWYQAECEMLRERYGMEPFKGLNLWGWPNAENTH